MDELIRELIVKRHGKITITHSEIGVKFRVECDLHGQHYGQDQYLDDGMLDLPSMLDIDSKAILRNFLNAEQELAKKGS